MPKRRKIALVEFSRSSYFHGMYAALAALFRADYSSQVYCYSGVDPAKGLRGKVESSLRFYARGWAAQTPERSYMANGMRPFFPGVSRGDGKRAAGAPNLPHSLQELEDYAIDGVPIGDLIYDHYCKAHRRPSPDLGTADFEAFFRESVSLFESWQRLFDKFEVTAVVGSSVYRNGFPMRIAISRGILTLSGGGNQLERLHENHLFPDSLWRWYPEVFRALPEERQQSATEQARSERLALLNGHTELLPYPDYYSPSPFASSVGLNGDLGPGQRGIIILTHDVFDSTHVYGKNFHTDFFQWFKWVCELSRHIDAQWFVKNHPVEDLEATAFVTDHLKEFPNITVLPPETNPRSMYSAGIRIALTVNGTIASEYPAFGFTVFNCSDLSPHRRYDFSLHPKSPEDLEQKLKSGLDLQKVSESELDEYYFMRWRFGHRPLLESEDRWRMGSARTRKGPPRGKERSFAESDLAKIRRFIALNADWMLEDFIIVESEAGIRVHVI